MRRVGLAVLTATMIAFPPVAAAKGPHASLSSVPAGIEPGRPWVATLTLLEYGRREAAAARPSVILRSSRGRFTVRPSPLGTHVPRFEDALAEARYRLRVVFPRAGRWTFTVVDGTRAGRRFRFPPAVIGADAEPVSGGYVAFPEGSRAEAAGAGGPVIGDARPAPVGSGEALPPEVVLLSDDGSDQGGAPLWIPAAGLTLAGVGGLAVIRRRRRSGD
jgi:MYXO-CTERM domain-containing protein